MSPYASAVRESFNEDLFRIGFSFLVDDTLLGRMLAAEHSMSEIGSFSLFAIRCMRIFVTGGIRVNLSGRK